MQNNNSRKTVLHMESVGSTHKKQKTKDDIISKLPGSVITRNASVDIFMGKDVGGSASYVQETESCVFILLKQFSEVKCIKFLASEVLTQPNVAVLPKFAMLSHLDLGFVSGEVLLGLLQKSSVLNTLLFKGISKFDQELLNSAVVPDCLTSTLQVVKFGNVRGSDHEQFLAKYFMENGMVLERMSFSLANAQLSCKSKWFRFTMFLLLIVSDATISTVFLLLTT
ncbi:F-box/FBD/LRR-repeat protein, partial [Trifolium medium]|nr:F-box/FBD/LRR-repeat protein [Trifolium medium]